MRIASILTGAVLCVPLVVAAQAKKSNAPPTHWVMHLNGQSQFDLQGFNGNVTGTSGPFSVSLKGMALLDQGFGSWIAAAVKGTPQKVDGALYQVDDQGKISNAVDLTQAVPTKITFSALDSKSKDQTTLSFTMSAAKQNAHAASGSVTSSNSAAQDQFGPMEASSPSASTKRTCRAPRR